MRHDWLDYLSLSKCLCALYILLHNLLQLLLLIALSIIRSTCDCQKAYSDEYAVLGTNLFDMGEFIISCSGGGCRHTSSSTLSNGLQGSVIPQEMMCDEGGKQAF